MSAAARTEQARRELRELQVEEWADLALGFVVIALSLTATQAAPALALPLLLGGVFAVCRGVLASVHRWELFEHLLRDSAAYEIPEVRRRALAVTQIENRRRLATTIRSALATPGLYQAARVEPVRTELAALADELEDETLSLEPFDAVRCQSLLTDALESPLLNPDVPADGLRIALARIRDGFEPR